MSDRPRTLVRAALVIDAHEVCAAPGVALIEGDVVIAAGRPQDVGTPDATRVIERPDAVLLPALVNAHCHLDLTHIGPQPYGGDFVGWVERLRVARCSDEDALAASVATGVALARTGGTALVGDIAGVGSSIPETVLRAEGLGGISYREVFGLGRGQTRAIETMRGLAATATDDAGVVRGLQPHAPYSCGPEVYRAAADLGRPLATHLAETEEEIRFCRRGDGPLAEMLVKFGAWDDEVRPPGEHPVDALAETLARAPTVAAHLNYVEPRHLARLAGAAISVAYCPRASAYFEHPAPGSAPHAYEAMLEAGVNVALGTDSLVCLDTPDRISVLDEMRLLFARDGTDPRTLLRMATTNGARALGVDPGCVTLAPDRGVGFAGLLAAPIDARSRVDPLEQVLLRDDAPEWIVGPVPGATLGGARACR